MMTPLTSERIREIRLTPAATVAVPLEWFERFGVAFAQDEDDLDRYEFAALETADGLAFGLLRHERSPAGETTLLLPEATAATSSIRPTIMAVADEFDIPLQSFHWRSDGEIVSISPAA